MKKLSHLMLTFPEIQNNTKKLLTNGLRFAIIVFALERVAIVSKETKK